MSLKVMRVVTGIGRLRLVVMLPLFFSFGVQAEGLVVPDLKAPPIYRLEEPVRQQERVLVIRPVTRALPPVQDMQVPPVQPPRIRDIVLQILREIPEAR